MTPAPNHRVHLVDQSHSGRSHMLTPEPLEFSLQLVNGVRARFNQQLVATTRAVGSWIMPNVEAQEIEALWYFPGSTGIYNLIIFRQIRNIHTSPVGFVGKNA
jgi:hypothetical protein